MSSKFSDPRRNSLVFDDLAFLSIRILLLQGIFICGLNRVSFLNCGFNLSLVVLFREEGKASSAKLI